MEKVVIEDWHGEEEGANRYVIKEFSILDSSDDPFLELDTPQYAENLNPTIRRSTKEYDLEVLESLKEGELFEAYSFEDWKYDIQEFQDLLSSMPGDG
jgi:hypothetical protein